MITSKTTDQTKKNFFKELKEQEKIRKNKIKELLSNTNYIEWLNTFTIEHQYFSDNDWLYCPEKISNHDNLQVENLNLIYEGIENYAIKNYIYPTPYNFGNYYNIKFNNNGYKIGKLLGQGTTFFCEKTEINNEEIFLDFYDIISNKKQENTDIIKSHLNKLSKTIISLYKSGIPLEAIEEIIDNALANIYEMEEKNIEPKKTLKLTK